MNDLLKDPYKDPVKAFINALIMKKSSFYRVLQVSSAIAVYSATSIWASTAHVDVVSNTFASLNYLLVILTIAVGLPYFCFIALGKLTTPPSSRNFDESSRMSNSEFSQDQVFVQKEIETMQYRGTRYNLEDLKSNTIDKNIRPKNDLSSQPVNKYRGAAIENSQDSSAKDVMDSFAQAKKSQKSAQPKERIKYRGSYLD